MGIDVVSIVGCPCGNDPTISDVFNNVGQRIGIHVTSRVRDSHYTIANNVVFNNPDCDIVARGTGERRGSATSGEPRLP